MAETNTSGVYNEETEQRKTNTNLDFVVMLLRNIGDLKSAVQQSCLARL